MAKTSDQLERFGCDITVAAFWDTIQDARADLYPSWTDEEMMCHPRQAILFCKEVRQRLKCKRLPDDFILRSLTNARKDRTRAGRQAA